MTRIKFLSLLLIAGLSNLLPVNKAYSQIFTIWYSGHSIGSTTGKYNFSYTQTPDQLVELMPAYIFIQGGPGYQWQQSDGPLESGFTDIPGATAISYTFPAGYHLPHTMYYRRKTYSLSQPGNSVYSNILKLSLVSVNWEDINYIREHEVVVTGITDWQTADALTIGQKIQTTTYMDGLGRAIEKVDREIAPPAVAGGTWGDLVNFYQYDPFGRNQKGYMPYTTTTESGKYKSAPLTEQPQYYTNTYNETTPYYSFTFDNSPLNKLTNIKEAGQKWAASTGKSAFYDVNTTADDVQLWSVDYVKGDAPVRLAAYQPGALYKSVYTDVNNAMVVEYRDKDGMVVLKKVQVDNAPSAAHAGWACTYNIYDDFGLLRFQIQPEGVKYLDANGWSFAGADGPTVLAEQVFQYFYDDKGRNIWKKAPGAAPINMIYDSRDRLVFAQDGNQAALSTPQWTATLYDGLDRITTTLLYNTTETISALQTDINNAVTVTSVNVPSYIPPPADLSYDQRVAGVTTYVASHSINFVSDAGGNFASPAGDNFTAYIDNTPASQGYSGTATTLGSPISSANLANSAVCTILKYRYYDDYTFSGAKAFDNNFTNTTAYSTGDPNVMPITASLRTIALPTGTRTRILGTNSFLNATMYYDEKGRTVQSLEENVKGGTDIITLQHHFDGRMLSLCESHTAPGTGYSAFITLTKYLFDKVGRVTSVQKQYGSNSFKTIASYDYDDMGRKKSLHLDPGYSNPNSGVAELESLNYSYNIHGQITGINKDYALKTPGTYNKWGHFFGMYLGYDNRDNTFLYTQLNGQTSGVLWNTQGDDAQRKYDYTYDNANRLVRAAYTEQQHPGDGWSNSVTDFSVNGGVTGLITYDLNGNLTSMLQKGVVPGNSAPVTMDDLRYVYNSYSNRLKTVTDQMTTTTVNGQMGDFKDGANAAGTPDYVFDNNGNLVLDLNKNVQSLNNGAAGTNGVHFNYLDKPDQIRVVGKGTILIVYNADGEKLQRAFIPEAGGNATITTYINGFVYQESGPLTPSSTAPFSGSGVKLAYINFENGRIRVMTPTSQGNGLDGLTENGNISLPNNQSGAWDYFIQDYQNNVRMILTEETHSAVNTCTMETTGGRPAAEDPVFGQTGAGNEVEATRYPTPAGWQSVNTSASVTRLGQLAGHNIGPNTLQKVMAGDQVTASVKYYYQGSVTNSNPNIIPNVLNSLAGALAGGVTSGTIVHGNGAGITSQLGANPAFVNAVEPAGAGGSTPQAFLTILFFDERFNLIQQADGGVVQQQVASTWTTGTPPLGLTNVKAPKNGYVFVYVSNRSDQDVYFDDLAVGITAGNIIEENHYYSFGLKIAGISSKKLGDAGEGKLKNSYLYNCKELLDEDADLGWLGYGYREYDPQIGKFVEMDPMAADFSLSSTYAYAANDPIGNVDFEGLFGGGIATTADAAKTLTECVVVGYRVSKAGYDLGKLVLNVGAMALRSAMVASEVLNASITTQSVGAAKGGGGPGPGWKAHLALIYARGMADAGANASSIGLWDFFHHSIEETVASFSDMDEKEAYLRGRQAGDITAGAVGIIEARVGGGGLASTGWTGIGALVSTGIALHGLGTSIVATHDLRAVQLQLQYVLLAKSTSTLDKNPESTPSKGGRDPVIKGQNGEASVGIGRGPKKRITVNNRRRIPDKLTEKTIQEVKNVDYQHLSTQIKDYIDYAKQTGRKFILWLKDGVESASGPLLEEQKAGNVIIKEIPKKGPI